MHVALALRACIVVQPAGPEDNPPKDPIYINSRSSVAGTQRRVGGLDRSAVHGGGEASAGGTCRR